MRAWEPRMIAIDPRGVARRAPGGPPKAEPGADAGPAAPPRFHIRLDSAVDQVRAVRTPSERSRRSHRPIPNALPHRRTRVRSGGQGGARPPGCICRIRRVTTHGRALRASGPELDDMNAVITAGRSSWRALIFGRNSVGKRSDNAQRMRPVGGRHARSAVRHRCWIAAVVPGSRTRMGAMGTPCPVLL
jgi:hypothetical protein